MSARHECETGELRTTVTQHLRDRHMDTSLYSVAIDEVERVATFMLFDLSGALGGFQQYRPDAGKERKNHPREGRYFTYKTNGRLPVFGLETWRWSTPLFVVEGIFDCVRIHNLGFAAIATLSNDPKFLGSWMRSVSRPIYAICDSGDAGKKLRKFADRYATCPDGLDLGASSDGAVSEIVSSLLERHGDSNGYR